MERCQDMPGWDETISLFWACGGKKGRTRMDFRIFFSFSSWIRIWAAKEADGWRLFARGWRLFAREWRLFSPWYDVFRSLCRKSAVQDMWCPEPPNNDCLASGLTVGFGYDGGYLFFYLKHLFFARPWGRNRERKRNVSYVWKEGRKKCNDRLTVTSNSLFLLGCGTTSTTRSSVIKNASKLCTSYVKKRK